MRLAHQMHHRICLVSYSIWILLSPVFIGRSIHELSGPLLGEVWQAFRLLFLSVVVANSNIQLPVEHEQSHGHSALWLFLNPLTFIVLEKQPTWLHAEHLLNYAIVLVRTSYTSELGNFVRLHTIQSY